MQLTPQYVLDRFSGTLHAILLSSQTSGTFQIDTSSALGLQLITMPAGYNCIITIENEQILCSAFSVSGATVTATIATNGRGYNNTATATHAVSLPCEMHWTSAHNNSLQTQLQKLDDNGLIIQFPTIIPTVISAIQHTITSATDYSSYFSVGRAYLFKITSTWYRAIVTSVSFGGGVTTINILGDALPAGGTIVSWGFEFGQSTYAAFDVELCRQLANSPAVNPPSGYSWLWNKAGSWYTKDSSGKVRFLNQVRATVSSVGGALTLDWSLASVYDITLTENVTAVTHSNGGEDGREYMLRIKQHASSAKTVVLGTAGGTRFSNSSASYTMTTDLNAQDILTFIFNATDSKFDLMEVSYGFQASPTQIQSAVPYPPYIKIYDTNTVRTNFVTRVGCDMTQTNPTYLWQTFNSGGTVYIYQYIRTTNGSYVYTGVNASLSPTSMNYLSGITENNGFVYVWYIANGTFQCTRYVNTDLTGVTTMTISGQTISSSNNAACSVIGDLTLNTKVYILDSNNSRIVPFTVSGTTWTAGSVITLNAGAPSTSNRSDLLIGSSGNFYATDVASGATDIHTFKKWNSGGTQQTSVTRYIIARSTGAYEQYGYLRVQGNPTVVAGSSINTNYYLEVYPLDSVFV